MVVLNPSALNSGLTILRPLTLLQRQLVADKTHRFIITPSGRRSRKTLIGKCRTMLHALRNPGKQYFSAAPTRAQAKAIFWDWFKKETRNFRTVPPNESDLILKLINGTEIHIVGLDRPARIEGRPWDGGHITEMADVKVGAWGENIRPLFSDTNGWAYLDGVPEGRGEWYDINLIACGGSIPITQRGIGSFVHSPVDPEWGYYHWFSEDVLAPKEIEAVKRTLDEKTYKQEYEGSFEGGEGLAYYPFSNANIKTAEVDPKSTIHIGMDFNYDPMCSVAAQETQRNDGTISTHILESFAFRNCDTGPACDRIIDHFGENRDYIIYPDPACQARTPHGEGGKTDLVIIRNAFNRVLAAGGKFDIRVRPAHPPRKDRLNAVNGKLKNAFGEISMYVDPACKALIKDFQKVSREEYLNRNIKDPTIGHSSDALGYYIEYCFPVAGGGSIGSGFVT